MCLSHSPNHQRHSLNRQHTGRKCLTPRARREHTAWLRKSYQIQRHHRRQYSSYLMFGSINVIEVLLFKFVLEKKFQLHTRSTRYTGIRNHVFVHTANYGIASRIRSASIITRSVRRTRRTCETSIVRDVFVGSTECS